MSSPMIYDPTVVPDYQGQQPNQLMRLAGLGTPNFQRSPAVANSINAIARVGQQPQGQPGTPNMMNQLMPMLLRRAMAQRGQQPQQSPDGTVNPTQVAQATPTAPPPGADPQSAAGVDARIKLDQTAVSGGYEVPIAGQPAVPNPAAAQGGESADDLINRITRNAPSQADVDKIIQGRTPAQTGTPTPTAPTPPGQESTEDLINRTINEPQRPPGSPPGTPMGSVEVIDDQGNRRWVDPAERRQNTERWNEQHPNDPLRGGPAGPQASADDGPHGFTVNTAGQPHQGDTNGQLQIHVTPTDDQMMHWNKSYEDQPPQVQQSLANMYPGRDMSGRTGAQIYNQDVGNEMVTNGTMYSQARAGVSQYYHDNGIPGSILQDGSTKQATVFHPSNISYSANGYQLEPVDYTPNFRQGGAISGAIPGVVQSTVYPNTPAADVPPPPPPFIPPTPITGE